MSSLPPASSRLSTEPLQCVQLKRPLPKLENVFLKFMKVKVIHRCKKWKWKVCFANKIDSKDKKEEMILKSSWSNNFTIVLMDQHYQFQFLPIIGSSPSSLMMSNVSPFLINSAGTFGNQASNLEWTHFHLKNVRGSFPLRHVNANKGTQEFPENLQKLFEQLKESCLLRLAK